MQRKGFEPVSEAAARVVDAVTASAMERAEKAKDPDKADRLFRMAQDLVGEIRAP